MTTSASNSTLIGNYLIRFIIRLCFSIFLIPFPHINGSIAIWTCIKILQRNFQTSLYCSQQLGVAKNRETRSQVGKWSKSREEGEWTEYHEDEGSLMRVRSLMRISKVQNLIQLVRNIMRMKKEGKLMLRIVRGNLKLNSRTHYNPKLRHTLCRSRHEEICRLHDLPPRLINGTYLTHFHYYWADT